MVASGFSAAVMWPGPNPTVCRAPPAQIAHDELQRSKREVRAKQEEIAELQRALSDANVFLYNEREQARLLPTPRPSPASQAPLV